MRLLLVPLLSLLLLTPIVAQEMSRWQRAYSFEDSVIEIDTSNVIIGGDIGRVTFRWKFDQPQQMKGNSKSTYQSQLETMEFKCADQRYRMYELTFLDSTGKTIYSKIMSPPYEWHSVRGDGVISTIAGLACELINEKVRTLEGGPLKPDQELELELERVVKVARSIKVTLERTRDFKALIRRFFAADFVKGYLSDEDTNWFYNLNRDTASRARRDDLQHFYAAILNAGYLTSLYIISQSPSDSESLNESVRDAKKLPPDIYQLIARHPYTRTYRAKKTTYDFLGENIDSIPRMRSYTDLLERIADLMRKHVARVRAERSKEYHEMLEGTDIKPRVCSNECLGLPRGTKLFEITPPLLRIQLAEIKGQFKIVSARDSSQ